MTDDTGLPEVIGYGVVVVRPGDKLIVGLSGKISPKAAEHLRRSAADHLPGVEAVFIECVQQFAVYRPENSEG